MLFRSIVGNRFLVYMQAELKKKFQDEQFPESLKQLEKLLGNSTGNYFVGDEVCTAFFAFSQYIVRANFARTLCTILLRQ